MNDPILKIIADSFSCNKLCYSVTDRSVLLRGSGEDREGKKRDVSTQNVSVSLQD